MQTPKEYDQLPNEVEVVSQHAKNVARLDDQDAWLNRNLEKAQEASGYKGCRQCCGGCLVFTQCLCSFCGEGNTKVIKEGQVGLKV